MELSKYAVTDRQREIVEAVAKCGSFRKAAKLLGVAAGTISNTMVKVNRRAASKGYSPEHGMTQELSPVEVLKGRSFLQNKQTGETLLQWTKTSVDHEAMLAIVGKP